MLKKTVMITGSSKGLGEALAVVFSENNYNVILNGRNIADLERVKAKILQNNVECSIVQGDLTSPETIENLSVLATEKQISILINNAAVDSEKLFEEISLEELEKVLETNLLVPIKLTKKIYPLFANNQEGTIVNINAMDGLKTIRDKAAYTASKHGLRGFTDALRYESKRKGVRVLGVYLSGMKTNMFENTGRDSSNCMEPVDVAKIIFNACKDNSTASVDEIIINKSRV